MLNTVRKNTVHIKSHLKLLITVNHWTARYFALCNTHDTLIYKTWQQLTKCLTFSDRRGWLSASKQPGADCQLPACHTVWLTLAALAAAAAAAASPGLSPCLHLMWSRYPHRVNICISLFCHSLHSTLFLLSRLKHCETTLVFRAVICLTLVI